MHHFEINREERHFGFLLLAALISNSGFRRAIFHTINSQFSISLNDQEFDIYAEVAIFRDYWESLNRKCEDAEALTQGKRKIVCGILESMALDQSMVDRESLFWTGATGESKIRFPGKWLGAKINEVESQNNIRPLELWRCKWLCNAKPDIMIESGDDILFIEVKVESGMAISSKGYRQEQTQEDIIKAGRRVIPWMNRPRINRIDLTHTAQAKGILWSRVIDEYNRCKTANDSGAEMIGRHFNFLPKKKGV